MAVWAEVVSLRERLALSLKGYREFPRELFSFDERGNRKELVGLTLAALALALLAGLSWHMTIESSGRPSVYIGGVIISCLAVTYPLVPAYHALIRWRAGRKFRVASNTREFARWREADQLKSSAKASVEQTLRDAYGDWLGSYGLSKASVLSSTVNCFPASADSRIVGVIQYRNVGEAVRVVSVEFHEGDLALFDSEGVMLEPISPFVFPAISEDFIRFEQLASSELAESRLPSIGTPEEDLFALMMAK